MTTLVKVSTTRTLVRVSKVVAGAITQIVDVQSKPSGLVRVSAAGFRPVTELFTSFQCVYDGLSQPASPGAYYDVQDFPFPCRVLSWVLTGTDTGNASLSFGSSDLASFPTFTPITGTLPAIANDIKASGTTDDWSKRDFGIGEFLRVAIVSNSAARRLTLSLRVARLSN